MLSICTPSYFSSITLADCSSIPISCVGDTHIASTSKPLLLRDVLVAPALIKNLISVRRLTHDNHVSVESYHFGLSVKDYMTNAEILTSIASSSDLYSIHGAPVASSP